MHTRTLRGALSALALLAGFAVGPPAHAQCRQPVTPRVTVLNSVLSCGMRRGQEVCIREPMPWDAADALREGLVARMPTPNGLPGENLRGVDVSLVRDARSGFYLATVILHPQDGSEQRYTYLHVSAGDAVRRALSRSLPASGPSVTTYAATEARVAILGPLREILQVSVR